MLREIIKLRQKGFTLMEVLIVATIVGILVSVGTVQYLEAKRRAKEQYCAQKLAQLAMYERMYFKDFGSYADFYVLRGNGYIDWDYIYEDDTILHYARPVYIEEYELEFIIDNEALGFEIIASPVVDQAHLYFPRWVALGGIEDLRSMSVDEDGVVRWLDSGRPVF